MTTEQKELTWKSVYEYTNLSDFGLQSTANMDAERQRIIEKIKKASISVLACSISPTFSRVSNDISQIPDHKDFNIYIIFWLLMNRWAIERKKGYVDMYKLVNDNERLIRLIFEQNFLGFDGATGQNAFLTTPKLIPKQNTLVDRTKWNNSTEAFLSIFTRFWDHLNDDGDADLIAIYPGHFAYATFVGGELVEVGTMRMPQEINNFEEFYVKYNGAFDNRATFYNKVKEWANHINTKNTNIDDKKDDMNIDFTDKAKTKTNKGNKMKDVKNAAGLSLTRSKNELSDASNRFAATRMLDLSYEAFVRVAVKAGMEEEKLRDETVQRVVKFFLPMVMDFGQEMHSEVTGKVTKVHNTISRLSSHAQNQQFYANMDDIYKTVMPMINEMMGAFTNDPIIANAFDVASQETEEQVEEFQEEEVVEEAEEEPAYV